MGVVVLGALRSSDMRRIGQPERSLVGYVRIRPRSSAPTVVHFPTQQEYNPHVAGGVPAVDVAVDMYAFGIVMWCVCVGLRRVACGVWRVVVWCGVVWCGAGAGAGCGGWVLDVMLTA